MLLRFTLPLKCPHCGQPGEAEWEETAGGDRGRDGGRKLIALSTLFHIEAGRLPEPIIVCNACDEILPIELT